MPRKGYKSITVKQNVYDYFFNEWSKVKEEYTIKKGIRSFSAFISYRLAELINLPEAPLPPFEILNHDSRGVKIQDNKLHLSADVQFTPVGIYCPICDAHNCEHIRFALNQPDIQKIIKQKRKEGWKLPEV
jgi:hypothetical protein